MVKKRVWDYSWGRSYKIKLEAEWEEHAGKEAKSWYLAGSLSAKIRLDVQSVHVIMQGLRRKLTSLTRLLLWSKSNWLFPRALGETISVCGMGFLSGRVTKVIAPKRQEGRQGLDRVLLDAGEKGLHVLEAPEPLIELPPRVSAALALANKCLM